MTGTTRSNSFQARRRHLLGLMTGLGALRLALPGPAWAAAVRPAREPRLPSLHEAEFYRPQAPAADGRRDDSPSEAPTRTDEP